MSLALEFVETSPDRIIVTEAGVRCGVIVDEEFIMDQGETMGIFHLECLVAYMNAKFYGKS